MSILEPRELIELSIEVYSALQSIEGPVEPHRNDLWSLQASKTRGENDGRPPLREKGHFCGITSDSSL